MLNGGARSSSFVPSNGEVGVLDVKSAGIDEIEAEVNIANLPDEASQALILWPAKS
jgi:hypothetical protein